MVIKLPFGNWDIALHRQPKAQAYTRQPGNYDKVFVIGHWKTGTTSLEQLLKLSGFRMGNQPTGKMLSLLPLDNIPEKMVRLAHTAEAFQDSPMMYPGVFRALDNAFPNSKFILTVRDSADQWLTSLKRFHTKIFSSDPNRLPIEEDLRNATYRYKGFTWDGIRHFWNYPETPLYDDSYKDIYEKHNQDARSYFDGRENDFIEINLAKPGEFQRLCEFLKLETNATDFPWENKT